VFSVRSKRDFLDVLSEDRPRLSGVRIDDLANVSHVRNGKSANVEKFDPMRVGPDSISLTPISPVSRSLATSAVRSAGEKSP